MISVYVETNFILELVLMQEQQESCEEILSLCEEGEIRLLIPGYSLVEPHETLVRRHRQRKRIKTELDQELRQITRNASYASRVGSFHDLTALLVDSADQESKRLAQVRERVLDCADILPLDATILGLTTRYQSMHDFSPQDSVVFASVISHLESEAPSTSCFLNRDSGDFDDPAIIDELRKHSCKWIPRFDQGLRYLLSQPGAGGGPSI